MAALIRRGADMVISETQMRLDAEELGLQVLEERETERT